MCLFVQKINDLISRNSYRTLLLGLYRERKVSPTSNVWTLLHKLKAQRPWPAKKSVFCLLRDERPSVDNSKKSRLTKITLSCTYSTLESRYVNLVTPFGDGSLAKFTWIQHSLDFTFHTVCVKLKSVKTIFPQFLWFQHAFT